ncbi:MAG: DNA repair exonuclease, partial [Polyangiaceae bacterium]|nr:DNA repair exonuclease [Polyangiaceae bacterium]
APTSMGVLADKGYDYWALGHVHRREIVSRAPYVVYPGNLQGRHVRETGPKGATFITAVSGKIRDVEHRVLDVVRWADIDIRVAEADSVDDVLERARDEISKVVGEAGDRTVAARVTLSGRTGARALLAEHEGDVAAGIRAVAMEAASDQIWIGSVRVSTRPAIDVDAALASAQSSTDPVVHLLKRMRDLAGDDAALLALSGELSDLADKLPEELRRDPAAAFFDDPNAMRDVLGDVRDLLLGRIALSEDP